MLLFKATKYSEFGEFLSFPAPSRFPTLGLQIGLLTCGREVPRALCCNVGGTHKVCGGKFNIYKYMAKSGLPRLASLHRGIVPSVPFVHFPRSIPCLRLHRIVVLNAVARVQGRANSKVKSLRRGLFFASGLESTENNAERAAPAE